MSYNDGTVNTDILNETEEVRKHMAKDYSEGNLALEQVLLSMWESGIKTLSCCNGHNEKDDFYLSIIVNDRSQSLLCNLLEFQNVVGDEDIKYIFSSASNGDLVFSLYCSQIIKGRILDAICNNNIMSKNNDSNMDYIVCTEYLNKFASFNNLNFNYIISSLRSLMVLFHKDVVLTGLDKKGYSKLSDVFDKVISEGLILNAPLECDIESLKKLLSIMFPNEKIFIPNNQDLGK